MKKAFEFLRKLLKAAKDNEITALATKLTYHLIFALFPFLIFLISLVGFFNIEPTYLMEEISALLPYETANMVNEVINSVVDTRNPGALTIGLIIALYTVANGFRSIMRGINRVYGQEDRRHIVKRWALCVLLVVILAFAIISSLLAIIYRDLIYNLIAANFSTNAFVENIFGALGVAVTIAILLFAIILIYRFSSSVKHRLLSLLPGAVLTIAVWGLSAWGFNIYISNFSNHSMIYGPITSIILTMLWLNVVSITILFGAQLNAQLKAGG
ncbi:MAG: YihY/virulence factor BrkB family protein [Defluviitaleaceae bacterium]|nr:YihY/virulence factor BrkB family protein [Defluviitaleaceae bacterium]